MSLVDGVRAAIAELEPLDVRDRPAADVLLRLAARIDDDTDWADKQRDPLAELAPKFLQYCDRFGFTPASRKAAVQAPAERPANPLDELRAKRAARQAT